MINKAILVGNIGQDAEKINDTITKFNLATSEHWTDKEGNRQEKTEWHKIVVFGKLAAIVLELAKRGSKVYVEGKIGTNEWTTESGEKRYSTEIRIDMQGTFKLLSKNESSGEASSNYTPRPKANKEDKSKVEKESPLPDSSSQTHSSQHLDHNDVPDPGDDDIPF